MAAEMGCVAGSMLPPPRARPARPARAQPKRVKMTARVRDAVSENALIATAL